jgi:N-carbamoyl-L-amino-acid hydrolase
VVTPSTNLRVDGTRLWESIMEMAKIGALPGGGCGRLALTDEDKRARDLFASWCERAGCTVTVDEMGNMFARRPGRNAALPPVAAGSHLDTQPHGGKFDGIFGVLAALEVVRTLNDAGVETQAPIEAINWTNEEGSRFAPAMIASGVFAGLFDRDFAYRIESPDGETLGDELARIGYKGAETCGEHPLGALFEAHIEQGPILERSGVPIGVVGGAQGQRWYDIEVRGRDSHAGTTPMPTRKDALVAAARMAARIEDIALGKAPHAVGTVGQFDVSPNSRNTIPGEVRFSVDIRHPDAGVLAEMDTEIRESFTAIAERAGVDVAVDQIWEKPPIEFDPRCVAAVREAAAGLGYGHQDIVSGAGHDACQVCEVAPTGMIFVPCEDGISHNEIESATPEDLEMGCNVLLHAMLAMAGGSPDSSGAPA